MENIEKLTSFGVKLAIFVIGDYWPGHIQFHNPPNIPCIRVICRDMGKVRQYCSVYKKLISVQINHTPTYCHVYSVCDTQQITVTTAASQLT